MNSITIHVGVSADRVHVHVLYHSVLSFSLVVLMYTRYKQNREQIKMRQADNL